jgi:hypothetical protein
MGETLQLEANGDGFVLRRVAADGSVSQMELTADNVLTLAASAQSLTDQILAARTRSGAVAARVTEVAQIALDTDIFATAIHLSLIDRHGALVTFALSQFYAQQLVDHMPSWIAKIQKPHSHQ